MRDRDRDRHVNEIRRSRLAQNDLRQVVAAAVHLRDEHLNGALCRTLETAIVVCYTRPFGRSNVVGAIKEDFVPADVRGIHDELLRLRDKVYAHTDLTDARDIVDVSELLELDSPAYAEEWRPLDRGALAGIIHLVVELDKRLESA